MMHLDTHAVVWLYQGDLDRFPPAALRALEHEELFVSPMVLLELQYLVEIGRLRVRAEEVMDDLAARIGLRQSEAPYALVVRHALDLTWTRDPFDRLIAATALAEDATLLTADKVLLANLPVATWE